MQPFALKLRHWVSATLMLTGAAAQAQAPAQWQGLPLGQMQLGGQTLLVVSASTDRELIISLGKYPELRDDEAVLHAYPRSGRRCLLTRDIARNLDAVYLDASGRVVEVGALLAGQQQVQCARAQAQQVLTLAQGRAAALRIKVGDTLAAVTPVSEQALAQWQAETAAQTAGQAQRHTQTHIGPRVAMTLGGRTLNPLLVLVARQGGMDIERERANAPLESGWLYVFGVDVAAGACRNADSMRGQVTWDPLKYRQYSFDRSGRLTGSTQRDDARLCAEGGAMRYALVLPQTAPALPDSARLGLAQSASAAMLARQHFDDDVPLPFAGHYQYQCAGETVDALLTVASRTADGSLQARLLLMSLDRNKQTVSEVQMALRGVKQASGNYLFSPGNTLAASGKYQGQRLVSISEYGARPLDHLRIQMPALACNTASADFAYTGYGDASLIESQQKLAASDVRFLTDNYRVQIKYEVGSSHVGGNQDRIPGFWGRLDRLFGKGKKGLEAWAYQCSRRSYTVTFTPKRDIPYTGEERYPLQVPVVWRLVQDLGGSNHGVEKDKRTLKLPVRMSDSVSEKIDFACVAELDTRRGTEQAAQLRAQVAASSVTLHRAEWTRAINRDAVNAESSKQWASLIAAINRANASIDHVNAAVQRQMEQDEANRKQAEALKKAAERAAACAREKARNRGSANFILSHCD